jgi:hypothetical protein
MSVTNRKMFRPRNARNKLNQMGGIMASSPELASTVTRYSQGGPVANFRDGDIVRVPSGNPSIPPNRSLVTTPMFGTTGSRSVVPYQSPYTTKLSGIRNLLGASPVGMFFGDILNTAPVQYADELAGIGEGKVQAYTPQGLTFPDITREQFDALSDEDRQSYLQAENDRRLATRTGITGGIGKFANVGDTFANTAEFFLENPAVERAAKAVGIMDPTDSFDPRNPKAFQQAREEALAANRPLTISQFRAGLPSTEERAPYATTEEQYMAGPGAVIPRPAAAEEDDLGFDLGDVRDTIPRSKGAETTTTETTQAAPVPPGEADKAKSEAADIAAIFDSQNIVSDTDPVGTAVGTDMEALKKKVMDLMPQWDEEASVKRNGLLLAQMGAAIAAGKSGDAITNIAEGMQKVLPEFVKEGRMRDKFKAELEGGAAKIAVTEGFSREREARAEQQAIAKENRQKKAYYLGQDVDVTIDGKRFVGTMGQLIPLTNPQLDKAIQAGIPLTAKEVVVEQMKQNAKNIAGGGTLADLYEEKAVTYAGFESAGGYKSPFKGLNYYRPNIQGAQIGLAKVWRPDTLDQLQARYTEEKNTLVSSLSLVNNIYAGADSATGLGATFNRAKDSLVALVGKENAKRFGLDADLSTTGELDVMQRFLAAQMAPIILGESGKTISDEDRRKIGRAIGFDPDSGKFTDKLFRNPDQIRASMTEIAGILQKYDSALQSEYSSLLRGAFKGGPQGFEAIQLPEPQQPVGKSTRLTADQFTELVGLSQ